MLRAEYQKRNRLGGKLNREEKKSNQELAFIPSCGWAYQSKTENI